MEEQSKPEREGKSQDPQRVDKPHGSKRTNAEIGMISKGSGGTPKAVPREHQAARAGNNAL
jgi:hypothetical protein